MVISERIRTIGDFILEGEKLADIGADHGYLELYLLSKYNDIFIKAIENKRGPYSILERNLKDYKNVKLSLSDGLDDVNDDISTLVLAGMGGLNIKKIIDKHVKKLDFIKKIVVDAHRDIDVVRKTLTSYGYIISKEVLVYEDNKFYVINEFIKGEKLRSYSIDEIEFGYNLYKDTLWPKYRDYLINRNNETLSKLIQNLKNQNKILKLKKLNERLANYGKE